MSELISATDDYSGHIPVQTRRHPLQADVRCASVYIRAGRMEAGNKLHIQDGVASVT